MSTVRALRRSFMIVRLAAFEIRDATGYLVIGAILVIGRVFLCLARSENDELS